MTTPTGTRDPLTCDLKARDLMTPNVMKVPGDVSVAELARFLIERRISGAVVLDQKGEPAGVVSMTDIAAHVKDHAETAPALPDFYVQGWQRKFDPSHLVEFHVEESDTRARDIMNPSVYTVAADAEISEVAEKMLTGHLHRILVTEDDELVGIISTFDFLKLFVGPESIHRRLPSGEGTQELPTPESL